jgi:hypothetical protein
MNSDHQPTMFHLLFLPIENHPKKSDASPTKALKYHLTF